ncbi:MAG: hypothetical protein O2779_03175 [Nanoarchaeota archaeon]|nr:hypothetical protein [Nanoarchaeota archaeon]
MLKNKKAQGLPLNVIIIAVIVLVVLVVLWVIFTSRAGEFSKQVTNTDDKLDKLGVDESTGELTGLPTDILGAFIPFIPFWRKRRRLV